MGRAAAEALPMSVGQRAALQVLARSVTAPQREVRRATALLLAADGVANTRITAAVGATPTTVREWRARFAAEGLATFAQVRAGRGRRPTISAETVEEIVRLTMHETPPGDTHWSTRTMAERVGVSRDTVHRIWRARGLRPQLAQTLRPADDPRFDNRLVDVVGLYHDPPVTAVALGMDESRRPPAPEHSQPARPMKPGRAGTTPQGYRQHGGTTTLFAALHVLTGDVIGQCPPGHRRQEFLAFLRLLDREVPRGLQAHLVLDPSGTHTRPDVQAWLAEHRRFHLHLIPTGSSWLDVVERWFRELTGKRLRRGSLNSVNDLVAAIEQHLAVRHPKPRPFVWTATAGSIRANRGTAAFEQVVTR